MPLPLTLSCSSKSRLLVLPFWCRLTRVIPDKIQEGHKRLCVFKCICCFWLVLYWSQENWHKGRNAFPLVVRQWIKEGWGHWLIFPCWDQCSDTVALVTELPTCENWKLCYLAKWDAKFSRCKYELNFQCWVNVLLVPAHPRCPGKIHRVMKWFCVCAFQCCITVAADVMTAFSTNDSLTI